MQADPQDRPDDSSRASDDTGRPGEETSDPLRGSRVSGAWVGVMVAGVLLILLIVFIAQNTQSVDVSFLGWDGSAPLAVAVLVAAAVGLLLAGTAGSLRIMQLRRRIRRSNLP